MPETVFGVPAHLLLIHAVVVLVPLSALGVVVLALVRRTRPVLRWPVLFVLTSALGAVPLATESGETFKRRLIEQGALGGPALEKVEQHQQLGELVVWPVLALWLLTVALITLDLRRPVRRVAGGRPRGRLLPVVALLAVLVAGVATAQVVRTGHTGATAVWNPGG